MSDETKFKWMLPCLLLCAVAVSACTGVPVSAPTSPLSAPEMTPGVLAYSGPAEVGSNDTSQCASLVIAGGNAEATLVACDGTTETVTLDAGIAAECQQIEQRIAPFVYETHAELLRFSGVGTASGPAWKHALLAWARARHAELSSGKVSAAGNTVLSWDLGPVAGDGQTCRHLTVLSWGYAYAETRPCAGGDVLELKVGWLETAELEQLDPWLYERLPLYVDEGYVAGTGNLPIKDAELAAVSQWVAGVWQRLWIAGASQQAGQPALSADACVASDSGSQPFLDEVGGYCLLLPVDYVAEQTTSSGVTIVLGSIMNHTDPRASIDVEDAAGRTLQQLVDSLVADYAAGTEVSPRTIAVGGVEAVVLDNLPGQDLNRRVVVLRNGKFYSLSFTPIGDTDEARAKMDAFYQGLLGSFHFLETTVP